MPRRRPGAMGLPSGPRGELGLAVAGAALGAGLATDGEAALAVAATAVVGAALALLARRPTAAWPIAALALGVDAATATPAFVAWLALAPLHAFGAAWRTGPRSAAAALVALLAATLPAELATHDSWVPYVLLLVTAWGVGRGLRTRERLAASLAERARELEEEREAYAQLSVRYERARIASELHDIVAHAMSVMVVQAGAGQRLATVDPDGTAEAFETIAGAAREAEEDMGRLVALLADEQPIGVAPDLALVEELVARAAGSGLDVTLRLEGEREGLPETVMQTAYRVVQESLTNALRYAAGAAVRVLVSGDGDALVVEVVNGPARREAALAGHGTGNGLRGLRERLGEAGGRLESGPTADGGWRVRARVPRRQRRSVCVA
jgi:signal transduction histidine kinase